MNNFCPINECERAAECGYAGECLKAKSEGATRESPGPAKVVAAVPTGSMSVAEAEAYCRDLDAASERAKSVAAGESDPLSKWRWNSHAESFAAAAKDMRQRMELLSVRQPTSNTRADLRGASPR